MQFHIHINYLLINRKFFKIRLFLTVDIMDLNVTFIQWRNGSSFYNGPNLNSLLLRNEAKLFIYLRIQLKAFDGFENERFFDM